MDRKNRTREENSEFQVSDRRFWVEDPESIENASLPAEKYPTFVEQLKSRTEAAEGKLRERLEELEKENAAFRNRLSTQVDKRVQEEKVQFVIPFLELLDNLERALENAHDSSHFEAFKKGVRLTVEDFSSRLKAAGVTTIDNLGQEFDPNEAEAVSVIPVEDPAEENRVQEVVLKGYRLNDKVLRPALVSVGKAG